MIQNFITIPKIQTRVMWIKFLSFTSKYISNSDFLLCLLTPQHCALLTAATTLLFAQNVFASKEFMKNSLLKGILRFAVLPDEETLFFFCSRFLFCSYPVVCFSFPPRPSAVLDSRANKEIFLFLFSPRSEEETSRLEMNFYSLIVFPPCRLMRKILLL